ncbi:serine/threonine-protein phosphatase 4 regulatory subunit 3-like [Tropilaelaps mercedesae]|uniref:Serine/threonine-protein phosphatase 4 regulatory subunit 3-like n=1 Tax=Tropilaelaps mercedesae TaxID=418985 RepID=A0A1V9X5G3_9ACAR|nr:serine/threonine-protein phosphatase 4 regulatory subunit 3-like [Tropilaelaps mercedesae]
MSGVVSTPDGGGNAGGGGNRSTHSAGEHTTAKDGTTSGQDPIPTNSAATVAGASSTTASEPSTTATTPAAGKDKGTRDNVNTRGQHDPPSKLQRLSSDSGNAAPTCNEAGTGTAASVQVVVGKAVECADGDDATAGASTQSGEEGGAALGATTAAGSPGATTATTGTESTSEDSGAPGDGVSGQSDVGVVVTENSDGSTPPAQGTGDSVGNGSCVQGNTGVTAGTAGAGANPVSGQSTEQSVRRRVKLYLLNAERQWDDKGTGYVSSPFVESLGGISLVVRAEIDGSLLLESRVQPETVYQRQQGTLIVWSEGDNYDLALSFQERAGCDDIWKTICQIQGRDPSLDITQEVVESEDECPDGQAALGGLNSSSRAMMLPAAEIAHLGEIAKILQECLPFPMRRDSVASAIEANEYITKLLDVFAVAEDLDDLDSLHTLYNIFKSILLLNKNALLDVMFTEENIMQVVGVLEYEPNKPQAKHREYLSARATFHEVIPFSDPELTAKIHQTYRVQYIQEVVLPTPSIFEENMLSCLSSFVFFNKADIVSMLQEDRHFLDQLFSQLRQDTSVEQKRDLVLFLKEFCNFSQTLQPQCREPFFKALFALGILQVMEATLQSDDAAIKAASIDILSYLVDFSTAMVREYCLDQYQTTCGDGERLLMDIILRQILADPQPDTGVAVQLAGILRMLLDPETFAPNENKNSFLGLFYKYSMHVLTDRIVEQHRAPPPGFPLSAGRASLLAHIIEFLSFCVEHHGYHIKNYILHKDLLRRVLDCMKYPRHHHLALCALRSRYNLLDSAIIELFEFIRAEDIALLGVHAVEHFSKELDSISYVPTFRALRAKFEEPTTSLPLESSAGGRAGGVGAALKMGSGADGLKVVSSLDGGSLPPATGIQQHSAADHSNRFKRDPRQIDDDEEKWFASDDGEDDDPTGSAVTTSATIGGGVAGATTCVDETLADDDGTESERLISDGEATLTLQGGSNHRLQSHVTTNNNNNNNNNAAVKLVDYEPDDDSDDEPNAVSVTEPVVGGDSGDELSPPKLEVFLGKTSSLVLTPTSAVRTGASGSSVDHQPTTESSDAVGVNAAPSARLRPAASEVFCEENDADQPPAKRQRVSVGEDEETTATTTSATRAEGGGFDRNVRASGDSNTQNVAARLVDSGPDSAGDRAGVASGAQVGLRED